MKDNNIHKEFSAEEFVENLLAEGSSAACDKTSTAFNTQTIPNYYDESLYKSGQRFFYKHIFGLFLGKLLGLLAVLSIKSSHSILILTNNSSSELLSFRRYFSTILHMLIWYKEDLHPNSTLWESISKVKNMHNLASQKANIVLRHRINQKDMALTQFGFMGFLLSRPTLIGVHHATDEDIKGFVHLWRVVGHVLGIEERFNICRESVQETREICNEIIRRVLIPAVKLEDKDATQLSASFINGMWAMNPFLDVKTFSFYLNTVLESNNNISIKNSEFAKLGKVSRFKVQLILYVVNWMKYDVVRILLNYLQLHALYMTQNFPYLAYFKFGTRNMRIKN